jgi:restriction endonuclease S subunit
MKNGLGNQLPTFTLGELARTVKRGLSSYYLHGDGVMVPLINIKDITNGKVNIETVEPVSVHETSLLEKSRISPGDLLVTIKGLSFKAAVADESVKNFAISANLIALTLSDKIVPEVVAAYLNSPAGQRILWARAGGATIRGLTTKTLLEVPIPVPPISEQSKLNRYLSLAREYNDILRKEQLARSRLNEAIITSIMG